MSVPEKHAAQRDGERASVAQAAAGGASHSCMLFACELLISQHPGTNNLMKMGIWDQRDWHYIDVLSSFQTLMLLHDCAGAHALVLFCCAGVLKDACRDGTGGEAEGAAVWE